MTAASKKQPKAQILGTIAHYRIVRKIGAGGMSIVYEAFDQKLKRSVALKILHPALAQSKEYRTRFFREAQAVAQLSHPNIVQIFDVCSKTQSSEQLYLVTELVRGETLKDFEHRLDFKKIPELAAMIIWQVAQALEHAHQRGIIHRDIKPENIMICHNGYIKLMDFGIARMSNEDSCTQTGTLLGSLTHLSPEVIRGQQATNKSDIFSLTTVFYWLLCGRLPFDHRTPHALLKAIVEEQAPAILQCAPKLSDHLAEVVNIGMSKNPKKRFKNALSMAHALEKSLEFLGLPPSEKKTGQLLKQAQKNNSEIYKYINNKIKIQANKYQDQGLETQAMILECRLDNTYKTPVKTPKKYSYLPNNFFLILIISIISLLIYASKYVILNNKKTLTSYSVPDIYYESAFLADQEFTPLGQNKIKLIQDKKQQEINFTIWPFANIYINNKFYAHDQKNYKIKLPLGTHKILFTHEYAASVEKIIKINKTGPPKNYRIILDKTKASKLVINANIEADVAIDGKYRGTTLNSAKTPIIIPLPDKTHAQKHEVIIQKEYYKPYIINIEFIAGKTHIIKINLLRSTKTKTLIDQPMQPSLKRLYI